MARKRERTNQAVAARPVVADYLVLTALEEERDALLAQLPRAQKLDKQLPDIHTYYYRRVSSARKDKAQFNVIVTCLAGMGPTEAATRASVAVKRWNPKYVLLVGIACGVKGEVEHGDVLLATQVADYSLGKLKAGDREIRWTVSPCGASLLDSAINVPRWQGKIGVRRPGAGECRVCKGVVASGGDVIADDNVIRAYSTSWPKLVGVEMEAGGIAAALNQTADRPEFLMIKGVSDFGADKHDPVVLPWRKYAAHAAAAFARALIENGPSGHPITEDKGSDEDEQRKAAERRWSYLQRNRFTGVEVLFLLKSSVGKAWLATLLDDTRISFSRTGPSFKLGTVISSAAAPNTKETSPRWEKAVCAFWEKYDPNPEYWVKRIAPAYQAGTLVAGFGASIPWADLNIPTVQTLGDLAQLTDIGIGIPPEAFTAGVEEFELRFVGEQFSFSIALSDHGLSFLHEMASAHFQASENVKRAPLSLGSSFSGIQLLEMFLGQVLPLKDAQTKSRRGIFGGMGGPGGRAIHFYPDIPKNFSDTPEAKNYVFTVTVPKPEVVKARIAELEAWVEDGSANAEAIGELAARYSSAGRLLDAISCLQTGIARLPPRADLHGLLGESLGKLGRHDEALEHFRRANHLEPNSAAAHCGLAICLSETGDSEGALRHFQVAAELEPSHAGHQKNLGRALASSERYSEAVQCYERAIEIKPEDSESLILLGVFYEELGQVDKAEARFHTATLVVPNDAEAHEHLGRHLAAKGDHIRAIPALERAIEIEESPRRYELLGGSQAELSRWPEAEKSFQNAVRLSPTNADYLVNVGICQASAGRLSEAAKTWKKALEIDPANPLAAQVLAALESASSNSSVGASEQPDEVSTHEL